jgi:hypothetical protein
MDDYFKSVLESFQTSPIYPFWGELRKGLLHRTSIRGYNGICSNGSIIPNTGQFEVSYPQTRGNYGFSKGYISLFDFESATNRQCVETYHNWDNFFLPYKSAIVVLRLNRAALSGKLIPNSAAPERGTEGYKPKIAYVEVWYPEPIPLSIIDGYILIATKNSRDSSSLEFKVVNDDHPKNHAATKELVDKWLGTHNVNR